MRVSLSIAGAEARVLKRGCLAVAECAMSRGGRVVVVRGWDRRDWYEVVVMGWSVLHTRAQTEHQRHHEVSRFKYLTRFL